MTPPFVKALIERAATPYRTAGRFAWNFARGKLGGDPVFAGLLEHGLIPHNARLLDIGCGQGLLASWLMTAKAMHDAGNWPVHWPAAPQPRSIHGIELMARDVQRAQRALAYLNSTVTFATGDMCKTDFGNVDAVVILDVLHYVDIAAQNDVLRRVRDALAPDGVLIVRVGDAGGGLPFKVSVWVDHVVTFVRGHRNGHLYCRPLADWHAALTALGFSVNTMAMNKGTPFANVLLVAKLGQNTHAV
jgi:SAM-dependent methyltransferase